MVCFVSDRPKIGVVTVTYNSGTVIDEFVGCLLRQTQRDFIAYFVDNASSDDTRERVTHCPDPRIVLLANKDNVGVAEGNNQGIRAALEAGCDYVLFINNDTTFEDTLIQDLVQGLEVYCCDMMAPKILFFDEPERIWCAGGGFDRLKGYAGIHYGAGEVDCGQFNVPRRVQHAPTCCLLVRCSVFERIGMMDKLYFVYIDDTDFCFRASQAGCELMYLPSARLFHKVSRLTGGPSSPFSVRYCTRNHIYFILKNLGILRSAFYLPAYQLHLLTKLLRRKIDVSGFWLRERAFVEGLQVWRTSWRPLAGSQS